MSGDAGPDAIGVAGRWLTGLVSGSGSAVLAILAIAGVGFALLNGRLALRRGGTVLLGIFLLFGAGSIARSLLDVAGAGISTDDVSASMGRGGNEAAQTRGVAGDDRYAHPSLLK